MRLGDLDHLLLKLDAELSDDARYIDIADQIREIINNAPTVHHPNCDICEDKAKQYSLGFQDGYLTGKERPQDEWIDHSDEGYVECPFCGSATNCEDNKDELHYCWNCGAEMRQEETTDE